MYWRGGIGQPVFLLVYLFLWDHQKHCSLLRNFENRTAAPMVLHPQCPLSHLFRSLIRTYLIVFCLQYCTILHANTKHSCIYRVSIFKFRLFKPKIINICIGIDATHRKSCMHFVPLVYFLAVFKA